MVTEDKSYWKDGVFYPDPTPVEMPLGYHHPETLESMLARMVTDAMFQKAVREEGFETFDESEDFDVMDEVESPSSEHEYTEMQQEEYVRDRNKAKVLPAGSKVNQSEPTANTVPTDESAAQVSKSVEKAPVAQ